MSITPDSIENPVAIIESADLAMVEELFEDGLLKYQSGDIAGSIDSFKSIVSTNPEFLEAQVNLGNAYFKANNLSEAINQWKTALKIDSTHLNCYINIGNAYYFQNKILEAIAQWQVALTLAPNNPKVLRNIGSAYERLNDKHNSFKYYEKFLTYCTKNKCEDYYKIYEKVKTSRQLALDCIRSGVKFQKNNKLRLAAQYYLKAINIYPNYDLNP